MNLTVEHKRPSAVGRKLFNRASLATLGLILTVIGCGAETPLKTVTFSPPSASNKELKVDFALPDLDAVQVCTVTINGRQFDSIHFTPADQLEGYSCAVLVLTDPTLSWEKTNHSWITDNLRLFFTKDSPGSHLVYNLSLATASHGQLKILFPVSEQTEIPSTRAEQSRLSLLNIQQAIHQLETSGTNRKLVLICTNGRFDERSGNKAEIVRAALAAHLQVCVFDLASRPGARNVVQEIVSETGGVYLPVTPKTFAATQTRFLQFAISGGQLLVDVSNATLPAALHFQVTTASGKIYEFDHHIDGLEPATDVTPAPAPAVSPITSTPLATPTPPPSAERGAVRGSTFILGPLVTGSGESRKISPGATPADSAGSVTQPPKDNQKQAPVRASNKNIRRTLRYLAIGAGITGLIILFAVLSRLGYKAFKNRFRHLDRQIAELRRLLEKRSDINAILAGELAKVTDQLTHAEQQLAIATEQLEAKTASLGTAKNTMVTLANGLWDLRRFLVLPGETQPRESFNGDSAGEMFDSLQNTINVLEFDNDFCVLDKTGITYTPGAFKVVGRRIRNELVEPVVSHTEKPEILWLGEQLARATVSLEIPEAVPGR